MPDFTNDFLDVHNDDLAPIAEYEGITVYKVNYHQALERHLAFTRRLIQIRKDKEKS
jgi:hypothetical protein